VIATREALGHVETFLKVLAMFRFALCFLNVVCLSVHWLEADDIEHASPLKHAVFTDATDEQKSTVLEAMNALDSSFALVDREVVMAQGRASVTGSIRKRPVAKLFEFRFVLGTEFDTGSKRYLAIESEVFNEGPGASVMVQRELERVLIVAIL